MASRGVNKVILIGNLGQDPEIRFTQDGNKSRFEHLVRLGVTDE